MFDEIAVLSPHRDDAVFSLAGTIRAWIGSGIRVSVWNFFTQSAYAPHAVGPLSISEQRKREDRRALRTLGGRITVRDFDFNDAPVRLNLPHEQLMGPGAIDVLIDDVQMIAAHLNSSMTAIAPLGLGNHIDHRTVRNAAISKLNPRRLAFYEDRPYLAWTLESQIHDIIVGLESQTGMTYRPQRIHVGGYWKARIAALYQTQVGQSDLVPIAGNYERIWTPNGSAKLRLMSGARDVSLRRAAFALPPCVPTAHASTPQSAAAW